MVPGCEESSVGLQPATVGHAWLVLRKRVTSLHKPVHGSEKRFSPVMLPSALGSSLVPFALKNQLASNDYDIYCLSETKVVQSTPGQQSSPGLTQLST